MDLFALQQKLVAAARNTPASDRVPYAFEKRVMALLASRMAVDRWASWARGLWRAAASCVVVALLLGVWILLAPASGVTATDLSQDFENTLLASVDQSDQTP